MNSEELIKKIHCGETSRVQFKLQFTTQKEIAADMVAFANCEGGELLFGVEDKTESCPVEFIDSKEGNQFTVRVGRLLSANETASGSKQATSRVLQDVPSGFIGELTER